MLAAECGKRAREQEKNRMEFVTLCSTKALPGPGEMREIEAGGAVLCVANVNGRYAAVDNACPHRGGPLAEGSLEGGKIMCPWHAWAFDTTTGEADHDPKEKVGVYELKIEGDTVLARL